MIRNEVTRTIQIITLAQLHGNDNQSQLNPWSLTFLLFTCFHNSEKWMIKNFRTHKAYNTSKHSNFQNTILQMKIDEHQNLLIF